MAKVKYDVSGVEDSSDFKQAPVGLYTMKVAEFDTGEASSGQAMGTIQLQPTKDAKGKKLKEQYARVWHRIPLEHSDETPGWTRRLKEFIKAVGLKEKGTFDTDKIVGKEVLVKLRSGKDLDDNYRPEVSRVMAVGEEPEDEPDDEDEDEAEDEDEDESETYSEEELEELDDDDLLEVAGDLEVETPAGKLTKKKREALIADILEAQGEEDEDEDEDDDDDDEDEDEAEDYSDWSRNQLVKEARSRGIKVSKGDSTEDLREALIEGDSEDEDEDEDEDDEDDEEDYSTWELDALKKEAKERGLKATGSKAQLAKRLEKDDESEEDPF